MASSPDMKDLDPLSFDHILQIVIFHLSTVSATQSKTQVTQNLCNARLVSKKWNKFATHQSRAQLRRMISCKVDHLTEFNQVMKTSSWIPWTKFNIDFVLEQKPYQRPSDFGKQILHSGLLLRDILSTIGSSVKELYFCCLITPSTGRRKWFHEFVHRTKMYQFPQLPNQDVPIHLPNLETFVFFWFEPDRENPAAHSKIVSMAALFFKQILKAAQNLKKVKLFLYDSYIFREKEFGDIFVSNLDPTYLEELSVLASGLTSDNYISLSKMGLRLKKLDIKFIFEMRVMPAGLSEFIQSQADSLNTLILEGLSSSSLEWSLIRRIPLKAEITLVVGQNFTFSDNDLTTFKNLHRLELNFEDGEHNDFELHSANLLESKFIHISLKVLSLSGWLIHDPYILTAIADMFPNLKGLRLELNYGNHLVMETFFQRFCNLERLGLFLQKTDDYPNAKSVASVLTGIPTSVCEEIKLSGGKSIDEVVERSPNLTNLTGLKRLYLIMLDEYISEYIDDVVIEYGFRQIPTLRRIQLSEERVIWQ